jgi:hypothetical protein
MPRTVGTHDATFGPCRVLLPSRSALAPVRMPGRVRADRECIVARSLCAPGTCVTNVTASFRRVFRDGFVTLATNACVTPLGLYVTPTDGTAPLCTCLHSKAVTSDVHDVRDAFCGVASNNAGGRSHERRDGESWDTVWELWASEAAGDLYTSPCGGPDRASPRVQGLWASDNDV